ncbi:multifunctional transcriptional regulator/nicotinamide-nucleotide adenylyltransferase/ribosylnicotinamide kinase NadR [Geosporobacter ferrireducens]|uniref:Nicotinate-nucleotide adenylyltransferase n=1 Tax=Geosporobacter ferrireducens TaxID=1424294 RepID=A0A1D8GDL1_9FIRM|nr:multifunctional transcriptional regulator/nicotinamide-nucleotide adenylyltransferase/ribosylnicotinamide kinase NadR [Geosporobacter ferrireducens]AOT69000.1 nicotinate-nucleotide adenylyltransferase [Geosporobacter ferrireducens]
MNSVGFIGGKFLPLHMGHVYAIVKAACMCDELYVVLSYSKARDAALCKDLKVKEMSREIRHRWLTQLTRDMENVRVIKVEDTYDSDETYNWEEGAWQIKKAIGKPINYIFSSENSYGEIFTRLYPEAKHVVIDSARHRYPISATKIRAEGVYKHWEMLPDFVRSYFIKKVVIVGTESCGKSTLTQYLAKLYNTTYVEEYGRTICEELGGYEDILTKDIFSQIAYKHKVLEYEAYKKANKVVFIDTEAIVTQYYSELCLGESNPVVDSVAEDQDYDLWIYLEPDVQWVNDGLRTYGEEKTRHENNLKLKEMLKNRKIEFVSVRGTYIERLNKSVDLVNKLLEI